MAGNPSTFQAAACLIGVVHKEEVYPESERAWRILRSIPLDKSHRDGGRRTGMPIAETDRWGAVVEDDLGISKRNVRRCCRELCDTTPYLE